MKLTRRERERLKAEGYLNPDPEIRTEGEAGGVTAVVVCGAMLGYLVGVPLGHWVGFVLVLFGAGLGYFVADPVLGALKRWVSTAWDLDQAKSVASAARDLEKSPEELAGGATKAATEAKAEAKAPQDVGEELASSLPAETKPETETETESESESTAPQDVGEELASSLPSETKPESESEEAGGSETAEAADSKQPTP